PQLDLTRVRGLRHVKQAEATLEAGRPASLVRAVHLAVDHHQVVLHPDLVRVRAGRKLKPRQEARLLRIAHIDDRGAARRPHMANERRRADDGDLPSARAVEPAALADPLYHCHGRPYSADTATFGFVSSSSSFAAPTQACSETSNTTPSGPRNLVSKNDAVAPASCFMKHGWPMLSSFFM